MWARILRGVAVLLRNGTVVVNIGIDEDATGANLLGSLDFESTEVVPICAQDDGTLEVHPRLDEAVNFLDPR